MGTWTRGVYIPDDGEENWALGAQKFNAGLENLAKRTQHLAADGTALDGDAATVGGNAPSDILLDTPGSVAANNLDFDPVDEQQLTTHTNDTDAHHTPTEQAYSVAASGQTTLSGSSAAVDTGVATDSEVYTVNFNPGAASVAVSFNGAGSRYVLEFEENTTAVGNPTVTWEFVRSNL